MRHYLCGWFAIDLISTGTSVVDIINEILSSKDESSQRAKLKMLRGLRLLRLFKMLRLLRGMRLMQRWETRHQINYGALSLMQSMVIVIIFAHWSACSWMLQIALRDHLEDTWLWASGYCIDSGEWERAVASTSMLSAKELRDYRKFSLEHRPQGFDGDYACLPPASIYSAALYWAVMTITSVGYGDIAATPHQPSEQVICSLLMLTGAFVWSQVVATFCGVLSTMYPASTAFRLTLEALNSYMSIHDLPAEMRQTLRDYAVHRTRSLALGGFAEALMKMSPKLQREVLLHTNGNWIKQVDWLANEDPRFRQDYHRDAADGLHRRRSCVRQRSTSSSRASPCAEAS